MKSRIRAIAADLRRGRNADAYLAAAAALIAGSLGLFGVVGLRWIAPVLLLCMVPMLNLALSINDQVGRVSGEGPVPTIEFPAEQLRDDWSRDSDVLLVGVTLIRTLRNHESDVARRLLNGKHVRVLVVNPEDVTAMSLTDRRRQYGEEDAANNSAEGRITLAALARLATIAPGARLEVRQIAFPIGLGGISFSPGRPDARVYVETYPFKTPETQPHFVVTAVVRHWFDHFTKELENMWNAGDPVTLATGQTGSQPVGQPTTAP